MAKYMPIKVEENTDPQPIIDVTKKIPPDGTLEKYDFTGAVVNFVLKAEAGATDASGVTYSSAGASPLVEILVPATNGQVRVSFRAADIATPGEKYYHLDAVKNSKREVLAYGPVYVIDV